MNGIGRLLVSCTGRPGIVAALSAFLRDRGANIVQSDQHSTDPEGGAFFMRTEFHREGVEAQAEEFERAFGHIPLRPDGKAEAERALLELLVGSFDLIVLARYMQILSPTFLDAARTPIINIHHSFLPAFAGDDPCARPYQRGVKLIGATAHYVSASSTPARSSSRTWSA